MSRKPRQKSSPSRPLSRPEAVGSVRPIATDGRDLDDLGYCAWCDGRLSLSFVILSLFGEPVGPPHVTADPSADALVPAGGRLLTALPVEPDLDTNPDAGYDLAITVCSSRCADAVEQALAIEWRRRIH